jgi:hypothetical protein
MANLLLLQLLLPPLPQQRLDQCLQLTEQVLAAPQVAGDPHREAPSYRVVHQRPPAPKRLGEQGHEEQQESNTDKTQFAQWGPGRK